MPKVSVTIPCFNSGKFIKETLESVLKQTVSDFEIVIIDDGSRDNTKEIVASFRDSRIKYFYKKENEGLSRARNEAINLSGGEYIAFLDHDDLWLPQKLEKQLNILEKSEDIGLVFTDAYILKDGIKEKKTYLDRCAPKRGYVFEELLFGSSNFIPMCTVVMPKVLFEKLGFFKEDFTVAEELDFFIRVAEKYKFDYINEPLAIYRVHGANLSRNREISTKESFDILSFWEKREPVLFKNNTLRLFKKHADILAELASFYALNSKRRQALHNFNLSLKNYKNKNIMIKKYILLFMGCYAYKFFDKIVKFLRI